MEISISDPVNQTIFFLIIFLIALLATTRLQSAPLKLTRTVTDELKGFAILGIIFSHIGYFLVAGDKFLFPLSVLAGVSVNLFLFLSGFGLTHSQLTKPLTIFQFYKRRLFRLYIPLWILLTILFSLNPIYFKLDYTFEEILLNLLGVFPVADLFLNINSPLWYFSIILFYYLIFPWVFKLKYFAPIALLSIQFIILNDQIAFINPDVQKLYALHNLAFPLGMAIAFFEQRFNFQLKVPHALKPLILIVFILAFSYFSLNTAVDTNVDREELLSLMTMFLLIGIFIFSPIKFKLFEIFGKYSYEIYLVHWPILVHFNFLYSVFPASIATTFYLGIFLGIGEIFQRLTHLSLQRVRRIYHALQKRLYS